MSSRTNRPFVEELPELLAARKLSQRRLAQLIDLNPSHLSRVLRAVDYKSPSADLVGCVAIALGLPEGYFPEYRAARINEAVAADPKLRDELYDRILARGTKRKGRSKRRRRDT